MTNLSFISLFVLFTSLVLAPDTAFAYIDPGTGSVLLQVILGIIAAVAVTMRLFWRKILAFFGIRKRVAEAPAAAEPSEPKDDA